MNARHFPLSFLLPVFLAACAGNPTAPHVDPTDQLNVELTLSSSHIHILSELTYTVTVTDDHGNAVTDFDTLRVERRAADSDTWRGTDLTLQGGSYVGTYTFMSSGDYQIRVSGRRGDDAAMVQMYNMTDMLSAARAHAEVGGYRVEFEAFPGHIHENELATVKFWVMEVEKDASGNRPAISGLATEIHCSESDGSEEEHVGAEATGGVYHADHTFVNAGSATAALHFTGLDGSPTEASFTFNVAHGH